MENKNKLKKISKILLIFLSVSSLVSMIFAYLYALTPEGKSELNINNMGIIPKKSEIPFSFAWIVLSVTQFCWGIYFCMHKHIIAGICLISISVIVFIISLFNLNLVGAI